MRKRDIERQLKIVFDLYKDSLEDIIDSNIDDGMLSRNNHQELSKSNVSVF